MLPRSKMPQRHDSKGSNGLSQRANTITRSCEADEATTPPVATLRPCSDVLMATNGERGDRCEFDQTTSLRYRQIERSGIDLQMRGTMSHD